MPETTGLELKFDPSTIEHLGIKMYSQLPQALAELVANAYDADASNVEINLYDNDPENKKIVVRDDGIGMSYDDVKNKFLIIGRKRRIEDGENRRTSLKKRTITGRKGLGKLALFGIGNNIKIETSTTSDDSYISFTLDWNSILTEPSGHYSPVTDLVKKLDKSAHGTTITLSELTRVSDFDVKGTAIALSKMFNFIKEDFKVVLQKNDDPTTRVEISRELRYESMQHEFTWNIEDIIPKIESDYINKDKIKGRVVSSPEGKVMKQDLRGITLYVNGRLANTQGFFGLAETPHGFSYLSGWIDADFLDELAIDLISTDRQSISWDVPEAMELQKFLKKIVSYVVKAWEEGRRENKRKAAQERSGVNLTDWYSKVPEAIQGKIENIVNQVANKPEIDAEEYSGVVKGLYELLPPYTYHHYRMLNKNIKEAADEKYKQGNYFEAIRLAIIQYIDSIKLIMERDGLEPDKKERSMMQNVFGSGPNAYFKVASHFRKPDGSLFNKNTTDALEDAQQALSQGMLCGFRHPQSHDLVKNIKQSGIITEQNCLDALSVLSMLYDRFENAKKTEGYIRSKDS